MKTYLTYKDNIQGFKNVSETVKTVEKIAAASIHHLKQAVINLNQYTVELESILTRLSLLYQKKDHPLLQTKKTGGKALIILTGDKGLVGGLWHALINTFLGHTDQYRSLIVVGIKGKRFLEEKNSKIIKSFIELSPIPQEEEIEIIVNYVFSEFQKGTFSNVDILYPQFLSLAQQRPTFIPFLPFEFVPTSLRQVNNEKSMQKALGLPIFEPSKKKVFDRLLQKYIGVVFRKTVTETKLSELAARTVAMEHASVKTKELMRKLILKYMRDRRQVVTQKQLESFAVHKML